MERYACKDLRAPPMIGQEQPLKLHLATTRRFHLHGYIEEGSAHTVRHLLKQQGRTPGNMPLDQLS